MAQYRKLKASRCDKDQIIVIGGAGFGDKGLLCKVLGVNKVSVDVLVLSTGQNSRVNLEENWAYDPASVDTMVCAIIADKKAFPGFSERMEREGWNGKPFLFSADEIVFDQKEGSRGYNQYFLRHTGETKKEDGTPYRNLFRISDIHLVEAPEWRMSKAEQMGAEVVELPLPPKPVLAEHNAIIEAITPWLVELNDSMYTGNTAHGRCSPDFKKHTLYKDKPCHANAQDPAAYEIGYVFTIGLNNLTGHWNKGHPCEEAMNLWITYLTSYSPYAQAFITKDVEYIKKYGYILDANAPSRILVGALYATRQVWERKARAEAFLSFYMGGMSLDEAFLFGCMCSQHNKGKMKLGEEGGSHSHLYSGRLTDECLMNFLEHSPGIKDVPYKVDPSPSTSKGGIDGMWSKDFNNKPVSKLVKQLQGLKKPGGGMDTSLCVEDMVERVDELVSDWRESMK